ncbi:MAG TPA: ABC transporter ATP-binding protein [Mycobacteriales bacterium]|nr:ABC transporter ATP-binding protein [Mycobacteriales bacterium]
MSEFELLPVATAARTRAAVRELLPGRRVLALGALAVLVAATAAGLVTAPVLGHIVDLAVDHRRADSVTAPVVLLALAAVGQGVLTALGGTLIARLGEGMLAALRERFVARALALPLDQVERAGSGDLTARVTSDVSVVGTAVRTALPELARSGLAIVLTLLGLALLDWRFLLVALLAAPIQAHTARWYARRAVPLYAGQRQAAGALQQQLLDSIGGARTVRAFGLAGAHHDRVGERSLGSVRLALAGIRLLTRFYGRLNVAEYVGLAAVLVTGYLLVGAGTVTIGTATAAALYFHSLFNPVNAALALLDDAQAATASLARLVGVADVAPPAGSPAAARAAAGSGVEAGPGGGAGTEAGFGAGAEAGVGAGVAGDGSVKVADLEFGYPGGPPVLAGIELAVAAGEVVAVVGASGAGKTTLAKLIAGVHQPTRGSISVGGADAAGAGRAIALITQEVHVFAGPLADDLRLARPAATDADLRAALAATGALPWVDALPAGLSTVVGAGGHRLTVTQAQQLALARLILADPPIAILDEATADAGSAGARTLEAAAAQALAGRTAIVIAHRLTQAAAADRILVLAAGRVAQAGSHAELCATPGPYATLWAAWSTPRGAEPPAGPPAGAAAEAAEAGGPAAEPGEAGGPAAGPGKARGPAAGPGEAGGPAAGAGEAGSGPA